eukprot:m51a1_g3255 hypothetical protein (383) ;mRNA; r:172481-173748
MAYFATEYLRSAATALHELRALHRWDSAESRAGGTSPAFPGHGSRVAARSPYPRQCFVASDARLRLVEVSDDSAWRVVAEPALPGACGELQCVAYDGAARVLAAADDCGRVFVAGDTQGPEALAAPALMSAAEAAQQPRARGPVALAVAPGLPKVACARHAQRCVDVYDAASGQLSLRLAPTTTPADAVWAGDNVVAVSEGCYVCLYDVRSASAELKARLFPGGGRVGAIAWAPAAAPGATGSEGCILATGADRAVHVLNLTKGYVSHRWTTTTKYAISDIVVSPTDPSVCYVSSETTEVVCGAWDKDKKKFVKRGALRVDSRNAGLDISVADGSDVLWSYATSASVYMWRHPESVTNDKSAADVDADDVGQPPHQKRQKIN